MADITGTGISQEDLVTFLGNVVALVNEVKVGYTAQKADVAALRAAIVGVTAKLDADAGITDTDYAATWDPAAITSSAVATSDLSLTGL